MKFQYESILDHPRRFILDTDIGGDCDDAGCLAILFHTMRAHPELSGAIINDTAKDWGCGAIDAIADHFGVSAFSLGQSSFSDILADPICHKYDRALAEKFSERYRNGTLAYTDAMDLYLSTLRNAEPNSVVLITVGGLHLPAMLWERAPELVRQKLYAVICMGGVYGEFERYGHREYNLYAFPKATKTLFECYPCPIICIGMELGRAVMSGFSHPAPNNPVYLAFDIHTKGALQRPSWDPLTVMFALFGEGDRFELSEPGINRIGEDGSNLFCPTPNGTHYYIKAKQPYQTLTDELNQIYQQEKCQNKISYK